MPSAKVQPLSVKQLLPFYDFFMMMMMMMMMMVMMMMMMVPSAKVQPLSVKQLLLPFYDLFMGAQANVGESADAELLDSGIAGSWYHGRYNIAGSW